MSERWLVVLLAAALVCTHMAAYYRGKAVAYRTAARIIAMGTREAGGDE